MDSGSESNWSLVDDSSIRKMNAKLADKDGHWLITPREKSIEDDVGSEYDLAYEEEASSDDNLVSEGDMSVNEGLSEIDLNLQDDICVSGELSERELLPCLTSTIATDINNEAPFEATYFEDECRLWEYLLDAKDALIASYISQTYELLADLRRYRYRLKRALEQLERMRSRPLNPKAKVFVPWESAS